LCHLEAGLLDCMSANEKSLPQTWVSGFRSERSTADKNEVVAFVPDIIIMVEISSFLI